MTCATARTLVRPIPETKIGAPDIAGGFRRAEANTSAPERGDLLSDKTLPITVVIAAYNSERFIGEALDSVFAQTCPPAQVVIVDDGSTDRSAAIAQARGATVIRQANAGVSAARNVGMRAATQPWLAFLDADDIWLPNKLDLQWAALCAAAGAKASITDRTSLSEDGPLAGTLFSLNRDYPTLPRRRVAQDAYLLERAPMCAALLRGNFVLLSSLVVDRDLALASGGFDEAMRYCEDLDLTLRIAALTDIVAVETPLVVKRAHRAGASTDRGKMQLGRAELTDRVIARSQLYPPGALEYCKQERPVRFKRAGMKFLNELQFDQSARALRTSLRYRFDGGAVTALIISRTLGMLRAERPLAAARVLVRRARAWGRPRKGLIDA